MPKKRHFSIKNRLLKKFLKKVKKGLDKRKNICYNKTRRTERKQQNGSIAQLGEHLPYKQRVTGSSPVVPTKYGPVVQLVRTPACHAGGRGFEPHPGRQQFASVAQFVEQGTENPRVVGSIPTGGTILKGSGNHSVTSMRI